MVGDVLYAGESFRVCSVRSRLEGIKSIASQN
jgi:hypothetical protein